MLALLTDEHQSFLFDGRDVAVTAAKLGGCVNDHGDLRSNPNAKGSATGGAYSLAFFDDSPTRPPTPAEGDNDCQVDSAKIVIQHFVALH
jgi:hypothetical protein